MKEVKQFLINEIGIKPTDSVVVAVSGGPDSMALLYIMSELQQQYGIHVICAHVNHNVRPESKDEQDFVQMFCKQQHIIFESMMIDDYGTLNFHDEARQKRYQYFTTIVKRYHASYLLTAHHGDDLMETILMRLVRGSNLSGYSGFSRVLDRKEYTLLHPLIHLTKQQIYDYLAEKHIPYVEDPSNQKDVYTRNRFRKYIVPLLREEDEDVHHKFYKFSETIRCHYEYIRKQAYQQLDKVYQNNQLCIQRFCQLEPVIQRNIIYLLLEQLYQSDLAQLTDRHVDLLEQLIFSQRPNASIMLPHNIRAVKSYQFISFERETHSISNYEIELKDSIQLSSGAMISLVEKEEKDNNDVCRLCIADVKLPLRVRNRRPGDKIAVKGLDGHKKLKDIFIDEKIPRSLRDVWPIVVDATGMIVWLPGIKKSKFDKTKQEKYDIILRYYERKEV
ncbi:MAG: tRNA lysidine(34) synthetase TilS [Bacilli bacterium]|jgi:tRNA(Ile)-lysidine synthase|nr:tRNA lysidine(34) synthetase TilS [Bacilli bacterium]